MKYLTGITLVVAAALSATAGAQQPITIQHIRPMDQRGINVFESPKDDSVTFAGTRVVFGGAFRQDFQGLQHSNALGSPALINLGHGFNNASANLNIDVQLVRGVRIAMTSYLSSRHHNETWVKDGYIQVDESPIDNTLLNFAMAFTTLKVGHFEINYGDGHFRRTDNGSAMFNPFVGNYILDAFSTEVGAEAYVRAGPVLAMAGMTNGEVKGMVVSPDRRAAAFFGKIGFDRQVRNDLRVRLTASAMSQARSANQTLYGGDRGGSPYFSVVEPVGASEATNAWSGQIRNPFTSSIQGQVINPFVKFGNAEVFGQFEWARGTNGGAEFDKRKISQQVYEGLYRLHNDQFYVGARYNNFDGRLFGMPTDVNVTRSQIGGGWFVTKNLLTKAEWVNQKYNDFPAADIRSEAKFRGFMFSGAVSF